MQNIDREPLFCTQFTSKMSIQLCLLEMFNPFLVFMCLQYKSFENTVGKGEIARDEQFLLFPQCFLTIWKTFCHFHQI